VLLEHLYDVYKEETPPSDSSAPKAPPAAASVFMDAIRSLAPAQLNAALNELEKYFSGTYACLDGNVLKWWKVCQVSSFSTIPFITDLVSCFQTHEVDFPVLARIARDILAIPGVSISVERLFSSSKHTLSDSRSSMTATSASKTVVTKELLKKGYGEGINYLDNVRILS
jgi:hypothetical protein